MLGHVGDGNFHQMIMYHPDKPEEAKAVKDLIDQMMHKAVKMEGTVSGEHGIGLGKKVDPTQLFLLKFEGETNGLR